MGPPKKIILLQENDFAYVWEFFEVLLNFEKRRVKRKKSTWKGFVGKFSFICCVQTCPKCHILEAASSDRVRKRKFDLLSFPQKCFNGLKNCISVDKNNGPLLHDNFFDNRISTFLDPRGGKGPSLTRHPVEMSVTCQPLTKKCPKQEFSQTKHYR